MKIYRSVKELESNSIQVQSGMIEVTPLGKKIIDVTYAKWHKWEYCIKDGIIAFVNNSGRMYVTPYTRGVEIFLDGRFIQRDFQVPFTGQSYPLGMKHFWKHLLEDALKDAFTV